MVFNLHIQWYVDMNKDRNWERSRGGVRKEKGGNKQTTQQQRTLYFSLGQQFLTIIKIKLNDCSEKFLLSTVGHTKHSATR